MYFYESDRIIAFASKPEAGNKFTYGQNNNQMSFEQLESTLDLVLDTINESQNSKIFLTASCLFCVA